MSVEIETYRGKQTVHVRSHRHDVPPVDRVQVLHIPGNPRAKAFFSVSGWDDLGNGAVIYLTPEEAADVARQLVPETPPCEPATELPTDAPGRAAHPDTDADGPGLVG